jgi:hypothetical protein
VDARRARRPVAKPPVNLLLTWDYAAKIDKHSRHAELSSK